MEGIEQGADGSGLSRIGGDHRGRRPRNGESHQIVERHQNPRSGPGAEDKFQAQEQSGGGHPQGEGSQHQQGILGQDLGQLIDPREEDPRQKQGEQAHGRHQPHSQQEGGEQPGQIHLPPGDAEHRLVFQQDLPAVHSGAGQVGAGDSQHHAHNGGILDGLKEQGGVPVLRGKGAQQGQQDHTPQHGAGQAVEAPALTADAVELRPDQVSHDPRPLGQKRRASAASRARAAAMQSSFFMEHNLLKWESGFQPAFPPQGGRCRAKRGG